MSKEHCQAWIFSFLLNKQKNNSLGLIHLPLKSMGVWTLESILAVYIIWNEMWQTVKLSSLTKYL